MLRSTETHAEQDFGELRFSNGLDEGWARIVTGNQAFGGTGASLRVFYPAGGEGPRGGGAQWIAEFDVAGFMSSLGDYRFKLGFENAV